jgi:hypothetical protein
VAVYDRYVIFGCIRISFVSQPFCRSSLCPRGTQLLSPCIFLVVPSQRWRSRPRRRPSRNESSCSHRSLPRRADQIRSETQACFRPRRTARSLTRWPRGCLLMRLLTRHCSGSPFATSRTPTLTRSEVWRRRNHLLSILWLHHAAVYYRLVVAAPCSGVLPLEPRVNLSRHVAVYYRLVVAASCSGVLPLEPRDNLSRSCSGVRPLCNMRLHSHFISIAAIDCPSLPAPATPARAHRRNGANDFVRQGCSRI